MWLMALVTIIVIDYMMGLSRAYIQELSSGFKGIVKKICYFGLVAVAVIADDIRENRRP